MKTCIICGEEIEDRNFLLKEKGYKNEPKYCEFHRRQIRGYREKVSSIDRKEVHRLDNVYFVDFPFSYIKESSGGEYDIYGFGGRNWGTWGGASHSGKTLFFVKKGFDLEEGCLIRFMLKIVDEEPHRYYVIEPAQDKTIEPGYVHYIISYYKTTRKGFGKDRNLKIHVESPHAVICEGSTSARSGRFGNRFKLIVSPDKDLKHEKTGVA